MRRINLSPPFPLCGTGFIGVYLCEQWLRSPHKGKEFQCKIKQKNKKNHGCFSRSSHYDSHNGHFCLSGEERPRHTLTNSCPNTFTGIAARRYSQPELDMPDAPTSAQPQKPLWGGGLPASGTGAAGAVGGRGGSVLEKL